MRRKTFWVRALALTLVAALGAAACGDDGGSTNEGNPTTTAGGSDSGSGGTGDTGDTGDTGNTGTPTAGGTITIGQFSSPAGLDPTKLAGGGTVGGQELAALYDTIVIYNNETGEFEPHTGAFTANSDNTVWTLKIKEGIKFGDGTDYDAEAVKFVVGREMTEGNSSPKGQLTKFLGTDPDAAMKVVDKLTLEFTLTLAWADFPYMFSNVQGWIYSPTQFQKVGAEEFNINPGPAGAGPFIVKSYAPGEALELERNPNYWGGEVYLDGLIFKLLNGPQATFDAIKAGSLQAGFLRDPEVIAQAEADGFGQVSMPAIAGNIINMNSGVTIACKDGKPEPACTGKADGDIKSTSATADVLVRRAIAHAVDPKIVNERAYGGKALPNSAPFANSPWDPGVEGPKADIDEAKKLIAEAKANGWDGKITLRASSDPTGKAWGESIRLQLVAAGFEVELLEKPISEIVNDVLVLKDYDINTWAYGMVDEYPANYVQLAGTFGGARYGYGSDEMNDAVDLMRTATTQEERVAATKAVSEIWVRDVPAHVITALPQALVHVPELKGLVRTGGSNVMWHAAYLEQ